MAQRSDPVEIWWLDLERERYDTSWRKQTPIAAQAVNGILTTEHVNNAFHLGRYEEGARDRSAILAYNKAKGAKK
jgi:hypothetical protein